MLGRPIPSSPCLMDQLDHRLVNRSKGLQDMLSAAQGMHVSGQDTRAKIAIAVVVA